MQNCSLSRCQPWGFVRIGTHHQGWAGSAPFLKAEHPKKRIYLIKAVQKQAKDGVRKVVESAESTGPVQRLVQAQRQLEADGLSYPALLGRAALVGVTFGTAFQVTHNNGLLPIYDVWPIKIGPFLESGLVPLVLAPIWVLYGYLYPLLDEVFADEESTVLARERASSFPLLALTWLSAGAQFVLSDVLYLQGAPHWQIYAAMAVWASLNFAFLDRSKTGLILGILLAIGAPLAEAVIVAFGLWHYERPDSPLGIVFWTGFCYASYAYGVGNYARWQARRIQDRST